MKIKAKRILVIILGILFLIAGLIGLALPFLQGFLFLIIGAILLSISSLRIRAWVESYTRKYPKAHEYFEKTERWLSKYIGPLE
jgi:uncharacterized protein